MGVCHAGACGWESRARLCRASFSDASLGSVVFAACGWRARGAGEVVGADLPDLSEFTPRHLSSLVRFLSGAPRMQPTGGMLNPLRRRRSRLRYLGRMSIVVSTQGGSGSSGSDSNLPTAPKSGRIHANPNSNPFGRIGAKSWLCRSSMSRVRKPVFLENGT